LQKYYYFNTTNILPCRFGLYQRPSSEEVCSIPLPVLATIVMRRGKKSVVRVAQRRSSPRPGSMNRDEGSYVASLSWQEPEEELNKLLLMKVSDRDRNGKVKMLAVLK